MCIRVLLCISLLSSWVSSNAQTPLTSTFTYQGELKSSGQVVSGNFDFEIELYDVVSGGVMADSINLEDVAVTDGIFSVTLDFGYGAFIGDQMWLEIHVRPGDSIGGFQQLLPRQTIQSSPYAIHAQFVGDDAITTHAILDGTIGSQDLSNNSVSTDKIVSNAVGLAEIDNTEVQQRISGTCLAGNFVQSVNEDGSVNCEADNEGLTEITSAEIVNGTITGIDIATNTIAGSRLINNSVTSDKIAINAVGTDEIASNSVGSDEIAISAVGVSEIASNAVGFSEIISTQVQRRVSGICSSGSFIQSINESGSVNCNANDPGLTEVTSADIVDATIVSIDIADNSIAAIDLASNSVGSSEIINNSITSADLASNSVGSSEIITNAVGSSEITINAVGSDEIAPNAVDSSEIATNAVGSDEIASDAVGSNEIATNAVGASEISSSAVGSSEIATNAVGSSEIATNAVGADEIVNGSVGVNEINTTEVQTRVNQSCGQNHYLSGINQDGSVICNKLPVTSEFEVDSSGSYSSIAIGSDGNPIISYYTDIGSNLKILHCGNEICSTGNNTTTVDSIGTVGTFNSIAIGSDGMPIVSYHDETNDDLKILHCGNVACTSGNTKTTVDSIASVGEFSSIAIGSDNLPIVSYYDTSNSDLKVLHCGNTSCSSGNIITTVDSSSQVGEFSSIAIGDDNLPVISYYDEFNTSLKVLHCGNTQCSSGNSFLTVDNSASVGKYTSIVIASNNRPLISYFDDTNSNLLVMECGNSTCSIGNDIYTVDQYDGAGKYSKILIGANNRPIISYFDTSLDRLKVLACSDFDCYSGVFGGEAAYINTLRTNSIPESSSIHGMVIGNDNNPILSYDGAFGFNIYACSDSACAR